MTNDNKVNPKQPTTTGNIEEVQRQIIESLRTTNTQLNQRIVLLEEENREYRELKQSFASNGNLTYYQAMAPIQTRRNAEIQREHDIINSQRRADWEAARQAEHDADVKAILAETNIEGYYKDQKDKIIQRKTKVYDAAVKFYNMDEEQARLYFNDKHKPTESAIMDLINEYLDNQGKFTIFQCSYCEKEFSGGLSALEYHCYYNGHDHRDINLNRIESNATAAIAKINKEFQNDIDKTIQGKKAAEYQAQLAKKRAADNKVKQGLPLVRDR